MGNFYAVKIWDGRIFDYMQTLEGTKFPVTFITFSPDGKFFCSAFYKGAVNIWDGSFGGLQTLEGRFKCLSPDGKILILLSRENNEITIKHFDENHLSIKISNVPLFLLERFSGIEP